MENDLLCKGLQESLRRDLYVVDDCLHEEWREENNIPGCPVSKILWFFQIVGGGAEEDFCHHETDIFAIIGKGALDVNLYHVWRLDGSFQGKDCNRSPR